MALLQLRPLALDPLSHLVLPAADNRVTTLQDHLPHRPVASPLDLLVLDQNQVTHLVDPLPDDPPDFLRDLLVEDLK